MDSPAILEDRLLALERGQRRLTGTCFMLAIALGASVAWQSLWVPREVAACRFVLKDAGGGIRGQWGPTDVVAGEINGVVQHASASCLVFDGQRRSGIRMCAPWEPYGGPSLVLHEETGASLHVAVDAYTVSLLGRTSASRRGDRGALVLGVHQDKASIQVSDKDGLRVQVRPEGLFAYESNGQVSYQTPTTARTR